MIEEDPCTLPLIPVSKEERAHKARYECDLRVGHVQCRYWSDQGCDSKVYCVLRAGHPGMHCHGYDIPSPTDWAQRD